MEKVVKITIAFLMIAVLSLEIPLTAWAMSSGGIETLFEETKDNRRGEAGETEGGTNETTSLENETEKVEAETKAEARTETKNEAEVGTETRTEAETGIETNTENKANTETEIRAETNTENKAKNETKTKNEKEESQPSIDKRIARAETGKNIPEVLRKALNYLQKNITNPVVDTIGGEWAVIAMARLQMLPDSTKMAYLTNLYQLLDANKGVLSTSKYTEYSRVVIALTAIGVNPQSVAGYDLLQPLADLENVKKQGINGPIFALIAFDTKKYEIPSLSAAELLGGRIQTTRESLIAEILGAELNGGGWDLRGQSADPDMTAMAIQALAPYYATHQEVKVAVNRGITKLSSIQAASGGFRSWGTENLESAAQVLIALSAIDVSLVSDARFLKNNNSIVDNICNMQTSEGAFSHVIGGGIDGIATDQGALALIAYQRARAGQSSLFDMTETSPTPASTSERPEIVQAFTAKMNQLPSVVTIADKATIYALEVELGQMKDFAHKAEFQKQLTAKKEEISKQEAVVSALSDDIWKQIKPLKISIKDKQTVKALLQRYEQLPKANQTYVKYKEDLLQANTIIGKLEKKVLAKEIFENVKNSAVDYLYDGSNYQIQLVGKNTYKPADMKAAIETKQSKKSFQFTTKEAGKLPGEVEVTFNCKLADGPYLLNRVGKNSVQPLEWILVKNKKFTCSLIRGGTYELQAQAEQKTTSQGSRQQAVKQTAKPATNQATETKPSTEVIVSKETVARLQGKDQNLKMVGTLENGSEYMLTLHGKDIEEIVDIDTRITTIAAYQKDVEQLAENPYCLHFKQEGNFPGVMLVEIEVPKEDGEYLLFSYDSEKAEVEYLQKIEVEKERTKFLVVKGGDYFIDVRAKKKVADTTEEQEQVRASREQERPEQLLVEETEPAMKKASLGIGTEVVRNAPLPFFFGAIFAWSATGIGYWGYKKWKIKRESKQGK